MAERTQETNEKAVDNNPTPVIQQTQTKKVRTAEADTNTVLARIVWYITGVVATLLALRFVLSLLGANEGNPFADLIYGITYPLVAPFFGLFKYQMTYGVARFETETLVAIAVYALVGYGIIRLITIKRGDPTI